LGINKQGITFVPKGYTSRYCVNESWLNSAAYVSVAKRGSKPKFIDDFLIKYSMVYEALIWCFTEEV
jgi:hypothetical protein